MQRKPPQRAAQRRQRAGRRRRRPAARAAPSPRRARPAAALRTTRACADRRPRRGCRARPTPDRRARSPARDAAAADRAHPTAASTTPGLHAAGPAGALIGRVLRDALGLEAVDRALGVVARDLVQAGVDDARHVRHGQRRLGEIGRENDAPAAGRPQRGVLLVGVEAAVQRHDRHVRAARADGARGARPRGESPARPAESTAPRRAIAAARPRSPAPTGTPGRYADLERMQIGPARRSTGQPPRYAATRRRIDRRRHHDEPEIVARAPGLARQRQAQIGVNAPLVKLVDDDRRGDPGRADPAAGARSGCLRSRRAAACPRVKLPIEPHVPADLAAERPAAARRRSAARSPARPRAAAAAAARGPSRRQRRRHARRLARARRGRHDDRARDRDARRCRRRCASMGSGSISQRLRSDVQAARHEDRTITRSEELESRCVVDRTSLTRRRRHGADDQGLESALPAAVHRAGRARARQRDGRRAPAEAAPAERVRADPPRAGRAVLRRAARRQQAGGNGLGRGARRSRAARTSSMSISAARSITSRAWASAPRSAASRPASRRIVAAMRAAVKVPVTVKIRLGWNKDSLQLPGRSRARPSTPAPTRITVHGRTREARYRHPADWDAIAEIAAAVPVPVIGNGDLLFAPRDPASACDVGGCAGVMVARGALIKPWIFREADERLLGHHRGGTARDLPPLRRARRSSTGATTSTARTRLREFLRWHVGFWCRYAPQRPGRHLADDAAARRRVDHAIAARGAARAVGRRGARLRDRRTAVRRRSVAAARRRRRAPRRPNSWRPVDGRGAGRWRRCWRSQAGSTAQIPAAGIAADDSRHGRRRQDRTRRSPTRASR